MTLTNGTIHIPLLVKEDEVMKEEGKGMEEEEGMVEEEEVVTRFILQQYSNQALHHLAPLAIGKFTSADSEFSTYVYNKKKSDYTYTYCLGNPSQGTVQCTE